MLHQSVVALKNRKGMFSRKDAKLLEKSAKELF